MNKYWMLEIDKTEIFTAFITSKFIEKSTRSKGLS